MHDRGVMSAFAAAYRQAELREGVLCCEMTDEMLHPWLGDSETVMIDENVARREVETMEWSADVGAGSQATAAAEMQRWA